jgi:FlaA1/EpsC-like NDP-sugar epimerase
MSTFARRYRQLVVHLAVCCGISLFSVWVAYFLRFDFDIPSERLSGAILASIVCVAAQVPILWLMGWRRVGWYGVALPDLGYLLKAIGLAALTSSTLILLVPHSGIPRSIPVLQGAVLFGASVLVRLARRVWRERRAMYTDCTPQKRVLIYGAGFAGQALLRALQQSPALAYKAVGFVDDNEDLSDKIVLGLPVVSNGAGLCSAVTRYRVEEVLIAIPSANSSALEQIRTYCDQAGRPCKTVPGLGELLQRPERLTELRQLSMEELLGRQQISLDEQAIQRKVSGRVVMVTGAAGSIGSEICRQLVRFSPSRIVAVDIAETPLFELENEFLDRHPNAPLCAVIGDVRKEDLLHHLMSLHQVEVVFHAAAYKHVPLMEQHPAMAVENNILGTYALANAAERAGVADVVMISTDKAVRPSSVMGATKRIAEMVVKSRSGSTTTFVSVRFGNVLGSNGSVIPIFRRQILNGGPVTVTHPEMRRYFMTIPEASQLVLQATAMGTQNEIFVLDMGKPVLIDQLAHNLISLHGLRPGIDISVKYTGLRPGEKLFEELYLSDENLVRSVHEKILVLQGPAIAREWVDAKIRQFQERLHGPKEQLLALMHEMIPDFVQRGVAAKNGRLAKQGHTFENSLTTLCEQRPRLRPQPDSPVAGGGELDAFKLA